MEKMGSLNLEKPVTFFVGENGTGKSTLIEAIAVAMGFNGEGGSRDFFFSTQDTHSELCDYLTISKSVWPKDGFSSGQKVFTIQPAIWNRIAP